MNAPVPVRNPDQIHSRRNPLFFNHAEGRVQCCHAIIGNGEEFRRDASGQERVGMAFRRQFTIPLFDLFKRRIRRNTKHRKGINPVGMNMACQDAIKIRLIEFEDVSDVGR